MDLVRTLISYALALAACTVFGAGDMAAADAPFRAKQVESGTAVELSMSSLREGEPSKFTLTLRDETTGASLAGVYPKVWMVPRKPSELTEDKRCSAAVAMSIAGGFRTPAKLDLTVYYVVAMNTDGSITVVDPHFSFGGSQLLGMVELENVGYDWALATGGDRLFVSVPASNHVAVVDTLRWKLAGTVNAGANPRRVVASGDGQHLFVATDAGVTILRAADAAVVKKLPMKAGDLAVTSDGRFVIVANADGASIIDARTFAVTGSVATAANPVSLAVSPLSGMAYAASTNGTVTVIDPKRRKAIASIAAREGATQIRVSPEGRFAFVANPAHDVVQIIDTASNRLVQTAMIDQGPYDVAFTATLAYVRRLRSETVLMIPLAAIGKEGAQVPVIDFPAGEYGFGKEPHATAAAGIVPAPGEPAVIVANPADKHVYYYKEGMAAPIGHFSNYKHHAQAVLVLDRSIRESRGAYSTTGILPEAGEYDVAVFVDAPRLVSCFRVNVAEDPAFAAKRRGLPVTIEHLTPQLVVSAGAPAPLSFRLRDAETQQPREGLQDAVVLIVQAGSTWFTRQRLTGNGEGRYETNFVPPRAGLYYVYVGAPSIGLPTSNSRFMTVEAR